MTDVRVSQLERDVAALRQDMGAVKAAVENHLPTAIEDVKKDVRDLSTRMNWLIGILFTSTLGFAIWLIQQLIVRGIVLR